MNPSFFLAFRHNLHTKPFFVPKKHGSQKWQKAKQSVENLFRKTAIYDFGRLPGKDSSPITTWCLVSAKTAIPLHDKKPGGMMMRQNYKNEVLFTKLQ